MLCNKICTSMYSLHGRAVLLEVQIQPRKLVVDRSKHLALTRRHYNQ